MNFFLFDWLRKRQAVVSLGQLGEELARREYQKRGYDIICSNFYNPKGLRLGEIDFVAKNKTNLVFVEVKTRKNPIDKFGSAGAAVNASKQRKILKTAKVFLLQNPKYQVLTPQIDVCIVGFEEVDKSSVSVKIIANAVEDWS